MSAKAKRQLKLGCVWSNHKRPCKGCAAGQHTWHIRFIPRCMFCMNVTSTFAEPAPAPSQAMDTHSQGCPGSSINSESSKVGAHDTTHPAGGSCGREMRLRSFECFPWKDHDPSFEHMRAPRRKTRVSWVSCSATMLSGGSRSGPADLSPSLIMT